MSEDSRMIATSALDVIPQEFIDEAQRRGFFFEEQQQAPDLGFFYSQAGLQWHDITLRPAKPLFCDFTSTKMLHRVKTLSRRKDLLAKATGLAKSSSVVVFDAMAGLGRDTWHMLSLGAHVVACERNTVIYLLLFDGLLRARYAGLEAPSRCRLIFGDAVKIFSDIHAEIDVVYLDPMFNDLARTAQVGRETQYLQQILGRTKHDSISCAEAMANQFTSRIVIKRALRSEPLLKSPLRSIRGKSVRYDIYNK